MNVKCPSLDDFVQQCACSDLGDGTIGLECGGAKLGDKKTSELLKLSIYSHGVSPLGSIDLAYNQLTRIPKELSILKQLKSVHLNGNSIRNIRTNEMPLTVREINLADNSLINIEPGAFNGETILNTIQSTQVFKTFNGRS